MNQFANQNSRMIIANLFLMALFLMAGCRQKQEHVNEVALLSRVQVGDTRQKTLAAFSDAWFHSKCVYENGTIEDVFFYGPKDPDQFIMILSLSTPIDNKLIVRQIGTLEYYFLDSLDGGCYQPQLRSVFGN